MLWPCKELPKVKRKACFPLKSGDNRLRSNSTGWALPWADSKELPVTFHQIFELLFFFFSIKMISRYAQSNDLQKLKQKRRNVQTACQLLIQQKMINTHSQIWRVQVTPLYFQSGLKVTTKQPVMNEPRLRMKQLCACSINALYWKSDYLILPLGHGSMSMQANNCIPTVAATFYFFLLLKCLHILAVPALLVFLGN